MRVFRGFVRLCAVLGGLALLGSYLGAVHPLGDSLAVFRLWIASAVAALGILALLVRARWTGGLALAAGLNAVFPIWLATQWSFVLTPSMASGAEQTLYQKNLLWLNEDPIQVLNDIVSLSPDHITLQEVHPARTFAVFHGLPEAYVSRHRCDSGAVGTVAVASRYPMVPGSAFCDMDHVMAAMQVEAPEGPFWVVSLHLDWPWPYDQAEQLVRLAPFLDLITGPAVIAGDFNMVPWSHSVTHIAQETDTRLLGPVQGTRPTTSLGLNLPIDHVLVTAELGHVEHRSFLGSDHAGLLARFNLPLDPDVIATDERVSAP